MLRRQISTKNTNFSLETLVRNILGCTYDAHDAVDDCKYLKKHSSIFIDAYYLNYNFTPSYIMSNIYSNWVPLIIGKFVLNSKLKKSLPQDFLCNIYIKHTKEKGLMEFIFFLLSVFKLKEVTKHKNVINFVKKDNSFWLVSTLPLVPFYIFIFHTMEENWFMKYSMLITEVVYFSCNTT